MRRFAAVAMSLIAAASLYTGPGLQAQPLVKLKGNATSTYQSGYKPSQILHAYGFDQVSAAGSGQTIAIVDAYGSPTIQNDLAVFNKQFGLPSANLTIAYPGGKVRKTDGGWALETSLDVEWAHAIAPAAPILLVVAKSASTSDLLGAVDYATSQGARVVSMSWGSSEFSSESSYDSHFSHTGVVYVASTGDNGTGVEWPAVSPNVVAVGGTHLPLDASGNLTASETAWSGSGGGTSAYYAQPAYQAGFTSASKRTVPDVALQADPNTGVAVYDSTSDQGQVGWFVVGGTSFSAPSWAALLARVDQGRATALTDGHAAVYQFAGSSTYSTDYRDIVSGTNGTCGPVCTASSGYDEVTGLGSPLASSLVPALTGY
ncbi:MAG: S8 family serine peptidase [Mycobacterium leprae]